MGCVGLESACIAVLSVPQTGKELAEAENSLELRVLLLLLRSARISDLCASTVVYGVLGVEPSPFLMLTQYFLQVSLTPSLERFSEHGYYIVLPFSHYKVFSVSSWLTSWPVMASSTTGER